MKKYQVFISYRRDGGYDLAGRIRDRLVALGYSVFLDVESMRSGKFNEQLYDAIEECNDFLLVLPPNGLDRCANPEDWVRLEIAHALKSKKNVVPIMARGFEFPETLPEDIDDIRHMDAVRASIEYFDAVIEKIETHLRSRRRGKARPAAPKTSKPPKEPTVPKQTGEIPLPRFLKVRESNFMPHGQEYLHIINPAHLAFCDLIANCKAFPNIHDYLAYCKEAAWKRYSSQENATRESFEDQYDPSNYERFYQLSLDFDGDAARELQSDRFRHIFDQSMLQSCTQQALSQLHTVRDYISHLYENTPKYYQTRIAELVHLPFFLNHKNPPLILLLLSWGFDRSSPSPSSYDQDYNLFLEELLLPHYPLLEYCFQGLNLKKLIDFATYQSLYPLDYTHTEVAFSVQTILQTVPNQAGQNEEIRRFLTALFALYQFLDSDTPWAPKKLRKYLLINYKYLLTQNVRLTKETTDLFRAMLEACSR